MARDPGTKSRDMAVAERLRRLCGVGLDEACVAVGKVQHEVVDGLLHSADHRLRLAEVALGITRRIGERNVHLPRPAALAHVALHYRVLAAESVLRSQALVDTLRSVALLLRKTTVLLQDPAHHPAVRVQLRSPGQRLSTVPER